MTASGQDPSDVFDDGGAPGSPGSGGVQEARWRTVAVPAVTEAAREEFGRALRRGMALPSGPRLSVQGLPTREGFVLTITQGKRRFGVDLALVDFEGMTRVQVSVPSESKPSDDELQQVVEWVQLAFTKAKWTLR